ncbi:MAG: hypothetical protein QW622_02450, partial [Candidatus Pacearchaeota archaeon]
MKIIYIFLISLLIILAVVGAVLAIKYAKTGEEVCIPGIDVGCTKQEEVAGTGGPNIVIIPPPNPPL